MKKRHTLTHYQQGILEGSRVALGQAITLIESELPQDEVLATQLMESLLSHTGKSLRIGITGVPGVGKSTFIEAFGNLLIESGRRVAVLTIDPSSQITRGSILGDKTRMETLSKNEHAFIRPSASGTMLGGVANRTRESLLLCEAAGFDVIIVETVGIGQSETSVKNMVDFFLLLMLAGAGDELQGIKKGVMEMADAIVITKADGENVMKANKAKSDFQHALHLFQPPVHGWLPQVLTCSALENNNIASVWEVILKFEQQLKNNGYWNLNRQQQNISWFHECFQQLLLAEIHRNPHLKNSSLRLEQQVSSQHISAQHAASKLLHEYHLAIKENKD